MIQVLTGYELDQGLVLKKSQISVFEHFTSKKKISASTHEIENIDDHDSQHLSKYTKLHSKEELNYELNRLLEDIRIKQLELAFVENMMFVVSESSCSQGEKYEKRSDENLIAPTPDELNNNLDNQQITPYDQPI